MSSYILHIEMYLKSMEDHLRSARRKLGLSFVRHHLDARVFQCDTMLSQQFGRQRRTLPQRSMYMDKLALGGSQYMHTYIHMHTHLCVYEYVYLCTCTERYAFMQMQCKWICIYLCIYMRGYMYIKAYIAYAGAHPYAQAYAYR